MKVLVTGGAGFIGSHLVDLLLENGLKVTVLDNFSTGRRQNLDHVLDKIELVECDISIKGKWIECFADIDWVFHLAALADIVPSINEPSAYFEANVSGAFNVLEAAKQFNIGRFIYSASSSCYGIPDEYPTAESSPLRPQYPYALTKLLGEQLVMHWSNVYNLPCVSLRFFNVYGPRARTSGTYGAVMGVFLAQKLASKPLTIVGNGEQTRDFTYVTDIAKALFCAAQSNSQSQIYNVGSGRTVSINRLAKLIGGETVNIPKRPGEPDCTFADITKISRDLQWEPTIEISEGVQKMMADLDYWSDAPLWTPETIDEATKDWFKYLG